MHGFMCVWGGGEEVELQPCFKDKLLGIEVFFHLPSSQKYGLTLRTRQHLKNLPPPINTSRAVNATGGFVEN